MKEASGEANMTVITIVLIGIIAAVATPLITSLIGSSGKSSCCQSYGGVWSGGKCYKDSSKTTTIRETSFWNASSKTCK